LADEQALIAALCAGAWADLTLAPGYDAEAKPVVPAKFLRDMLLGLDSRVAGLPSGLRIRGIRVEGDLDLADCTAPGGGGFGVLALEHCDFTGRIDITNAELSRFSIRQSRFRELWGEGVKVSGDFDFRGAAPFPSSDAAAAYIRLRAARIGGDLWARGALLKCPGDVPRGLTMVPPALNLWLARIEGSALFEMGFVAEGDVRMSSAFIGGDLAFDGATITGRDGLALDAAGVHIGGEATFDLLDERRFMATGEVRVSNASIGKNLSFFGASLSNPDGDALDASASTIGGHVRLTIANGHRFEAEGQAVFWDTKVSGDFICNAARLSAPGRVALSAGNLQVGGRASFDVSGGTRFEADGEVRLANSSIGKALSFSGARLSNPGADALDANACSVGGHVQLMPIGGHRFETEGASLFWDARVAGDFACHGARFSNPGGLALAAAGIQIGGLAIFDADEEFRFESAGEVRLTNGSIGKSLSFFGAALSNPEGDALDASACTVGGHVRLVAINDHNFEADGTTTFWKAKVSGDFVCQGARFTRPDGVALNACACSVDGGLYAHDNTLDGIFDLSNARIDTLGSFADSAWSGARRIRLDSISLRQIEVDQSDGVAWQARMRWLQRSTDRTAKGQRIVSPHPWQECAVAFARSGRHADARRIQREGYREANRARPLWIRPFVWLFAEVPFGFGLSALRATITLILFWIAGTLGAQTMQARHVLMNLDNPGDPQACRTLIPALYALDTAIPIIDLRQEALCDPADVGQPGLFPGIALADLTRALPMLPAVPSILLFNEGDLWTWAKAVYALLGTFLVSFAGITYSGVFKPKE
jgi:hypothetical protein